MDEKPTEEEDKKPTEEKDSHRNIKRYAKYGLAIGVGAALPVLGVPALIGAIGFGSGGIAAGSAAAGLMSMSATSGVGAGVVAACQSIGAAGFAASTSVGLGAAGAFVGKKCADATEGDNGKSSQKPPGDDKNTTKSDDCKKAPEIFQGCKVSGDKWQERDAKLCLKPLGGSQMQLQIRLDANPEDSSLDVMMTAGMKLLHEPKSKQIRLQCSDNSMLRIIFPTIQDTDKFVKNFSERKNMLC